MPVAEAPIIKVDVHQGGELVQLGGDPPTLDPHMSHDVLSDTYIAEIFGGLVTLDLDLRVIPDLAERWDLSSDGREYTFFLRRDARFHDGRGVTAEDVRWSLERATDPETQGPVPDAYLGDILGVREKLEGQAREVAGLEVVDEYTLLIRLRYASAVFLHKLTKAAAFVLDRHTMAAREDWTRHPIGTGPFKLARYVKGNRLVLERNEFYHLTPPYLDRITFLLGHANPLLLYERDEVHTSYVPSSDRERVLDPAHRLFHEVNRAPGHMSVTYIGLNANKPPLDDVKVRQALACAIDKNQVAFSEMEVPAHGILPPGFPGYNPGLTTQGYDPERARRLLEESKYGNGLENLPPMAIMVPEGIHLAKVLEMWHQNLGIDVEVERVLFPDFLNELKRRRFHMYAAGWAVDYPDAENLLDLPFHSRSSYNHTGYVNLDLDHLVERARAESDMQARMQLYSQVEEIVLRDAPWIPLTHPEEQLVLVKPYVHHFPLMPVAIPRYRYVYLGR